MFSWGTSHESVYGVACENFEGPTSNSKIRKGKFDTPDLSKRYTWVEVAEGVHFSRGSPIWRCRVDRSQIADPAGCAAPVGSKSHPHDPEIGPSTFDGQFLENSLLYFV